MNTDNFPAVWQLRPNATRCAVEASAVSETELEVDQVGSGLEFSIMVALCPSTIVSDCSPARHNQSTTIGSPTKPSRRNKR